MFVGFSRICLLGILIFKGLTARRLYKFFGVKGLMVIQTFQMGPEGSSFRSRQCIASNYT
jgi:hypothetical protein